MSRISSSESNGILRRRRASEHHIGPIQREEPIYQGDSIARGLPSVHFLEVVGIHIPLRMKGYSVNHLIVCITDDRVRSATKGGFQLMLYFPSAGCIHSYISVLTFLPGKFKLCGNDMIDAHVENLVDSKQPTGFPQSLGKLYDFPTIIWITASQLPTFPQSLQLLIFFIKGIDTR